MAKNPEDFAPRPAASIKAEALSSATWRHNPADPIVIVSTMQFGFTIPLWDAEGRIPGGDVQAPAFDLRTEIGLTVLSAAVPVFSLFGVASNSYAPPVKDEDRAWVTAFMTKPDRLRMPPFVDETTGKEKIGDIEGLYLRALESVGYGRGGVYNPMEPDRSRFLTGPGRVHPEVMVMRSSSLWADGKEANDARAVLLDVTRYSKSEAHVGALHDMAVLAGSVGSSIVDACRRRATHAGWRR